MKYNELERKLRAAGCIEHGGNKKRRHPLWHSPITGRDFTTSHHGGEEVKPGTLKSILRDAGIKL